MVLQPYQLSRACPSPTHTLVRSAGLDDTDGIDSACVFLVTYDLLTRGDALRQHIVSRKPGVMIVDESHYCKNGDAKRTQVGFKMFVDVHAAEQLE